MVRHESGYEVVAVVISLLEAQRDWLLHMLACLLEALRPQLPLRIEAVRRTHIQQNIVELSAALGDEQGGVILCPRLGGLCAQISPEGLQTPRTA